MRAEHYKQKYEELARWFLNFDHRARGIDYGDDAAFDGAIVDLGEAIDVAIDNWLDEHKAKNTDTKSRIDRFGKGGFGSSS